jgi:hypothetical protein
MVVDARNAVSPVWAKCPGVNNPSRIFVRFNNKKFEPHAEENGRNDPSPRTGRKWATTRGMSNDGAIDVAILRLPEDFASGDYDVHSLIFSGSGKPEEIALSGIGSQIASVRLVPG